MPKKRDIGSAQWLVKFDAALAAIGPHYIAKAMHGLDADFQRLASAWKIFSS